jgi:hypothetical protein
MQPLPIRTSAKDWEKKKEKKVREQLIKGLSEHRDIPFHLKSKTQIQNTQRYIMRKA